MSADDKWCKCNAGHIYGIYIWTAGAFDWHNPGRKSKFLWSWTPDRVKGGQQPRISTKLMSGFEHWFDGQPDNHLGDERCVNLWRNYNYRWNDEECEHKYCFVCQNFL